MKLRFVAAFLASSVLATSAFAGFFTGDTTGKPTWQRPLAGSPPIFLSSIGTNVPFEVTTFTVTADGTYSFVNDALTPGFDNFLHLYRDSFDPTSQFTNILIGNDDLGFIGRSGFSFGLLTGVTYFAVTSGFENSDFGAWEMTISGPGDVIGGGGGGGGAVPEPGTWAMLIAGFGLVGAGLRRRRDATATA